MEQIKYTIPDYNPYLAIMEFTTDCVKNRHMQEMQKKRIQRAI